MQQVKRQRCSAKSAIRMIAFTALVFLCCLFVSSIYKSNDHVPYVRHYIRQTADNIRYGNSIHSGNRITIRATDSGIFYLKGMIGTSYNDKYGYWEEENSSSDSTYSGMMRYLADREFYPQSQLVQSLGLLEDEWNTIYIQNNTATRKYIYTPQCISAIWKNDYSNTQDNPNRIIPKNVFGDSEYQFDYWSSEDAVDVATRDDIDATRSYAGLEELYRSYVYDNYMDIPEEMRREFDHTNLESVGGISQAEVLMTARIFLSEQEDMSPEELATYTVLLLRYLGIPSRYVDGYYARYEQANSRQILTESDRHQWAEVYLDGVGFVQFETNPDYLEIYSENQTMSNDLQSQIMGQNENPEDIKDTAKSNQIWIFLLFVAMALFLVCIILLFCYKMKNKKRLYSKNMMEFTSFLCIRLEKVLKYDNVLIDMKRPYACQKSILNQYGSEFYRLYIRFIRYADEVQFNHTVLTEEEQCEMRIILKRFEMKVSDGMNPLKRIWFFY